MSSSREPYQGLGWLFRCEKRRSRVQSHSSVNTHTSTCIEQQSVIGSHLDLCAISPSTFTTQRLQASPHHLKQSRTVIASIMHFQHDTSQLAASSAITCATTIALRYFIGGFIPLLPYFFASHVTERWLRNIRVMGVALSAFGYIKKGM